MKKTSTLCLLAVAALAGWASVETFRLWEATQQADASQQTQLRTAAKLEATRAKKVQVVNSDPVPSPAATQK